MEETAVGKTKERGTNEGKTRGIGVEIGRRRTWKRVGGEVGKNRRRRLRVYC